MPRPTSCAFRLSQLTGLPAASIQTSTETIPDMPNVAQNQDLPGEALKETTLLSKSRTQRPRAKEFRAQAERRQLYPAVDFVGQYAVLARFNNYDQFFQKVSATQCHRRCGHPLPFLQPGTTRSG